MTFETRLLAELRTVVEGNARPRWRPRIAAVAAGVAAISAVLAVGLGRAGPDDSAGPLAPQPAYAVEKRPDGGVAVTVKDVRRADGLQRKLTAAGVPAKVVLSRPGCVEKPALLVDGVFGDEPPDREHFFTIYPKALPRGTEILIGLPGPGDAATGYAAMAVYRKGETPDCVRASEPVRTP